MSVAETNKATIQARIDEIDRRIAELRDERARLLTVRGDVHLTFAPSGAVAANGRNIEKLRTLGRSTEVLSGLKHGLSTSALMKKLGDSKLAGRNPITVRSHLRRLREEGLLEFDVAKKRWRLPSQEAKQE